MGVWRKQKDPAALRHTLDRLLAMAEMSPLGMGR
jgi:hypothetical protein